MKKYLLPSFLLIAYTWILIKVMVFKDMPMITLGHVRFNFGGTQEGPPNLIPFKTILPYLLGEKGLLIAFINIIGNIALLVPVGFLVPFIDRNMTWKKSLLLGLAAGLAIEGMQAVLHVGIFDIDDVLLNGLGVMTGYWFFKLFTKWMLPINTRKAIMLAVLIIATTGAAYAIFVSRIQAGPEDIIRREEMSQVAAIQNRPADTTINNQSGSADTLKSNPDKLPDPCGGTGGTGQIVRVGNNSFTIKAHNGTEKLINTSDKTIFKNAVTSITFTDLKIGNNVTVVVYPNREGIETATTVLVCNDSSREPRH